MTFFVQGLDGHETMPLTRLFKPRRIKEPAKIDPYKGVTAHKEPPNIPYNNDKLHHKKQLSQKGQSGIAIQSYQVVEQLPQGSPILLANQIMTSPVITLHANDTILDALTLFQKHQLRHIPVTTDTSMVIGIISDRDVLHYLSGISEKFKPTAVSTRTTDQVRLIMKTKVLTASTDTDVRYIARLFVEQRVGAMPIVTDGSLSGIITRCDLLGAIMRYFILELWA